MRLLYSFAKPQFLFRPQQALLRLIREFSHHDNNPIEVTLPWGVRFLIDRSETIGRAIWHQGLYDLTVSEALWRLLDAGDTAIDVGANSGHMTSLMAVRTGQSGRVLAFEPHPQIFAELQQNIARCQSDRAVGQIEAHQLALSDQEGEGLLICDNQFEQNRGVAHLAVSTSQTTSQTNGIVVKKSRLDDLLANRSAAVMKLDVEGHELSVLQGAAETLAAGQIKNIIYEDFHGLQSPVHQYLKKFGYSLFALGWKTFGPLLAPLADYQQIQTDYEPPNYLATNTPAEALTRFRRRGWQVL